MRPSDPGNADRRADCCRKCPGLVQPTSPSLKIYQCRLMVRLRSPKPSMRVRFLPLVPSLVSFWSSCRDWCLYPAVTRTPLAGMSVRITPAPPLLIIAGRSQIKLSTIRMQYKSPVNEGELGAQYLTKFLTRKRWAGCTRRSHNPLLGRVRFPLPLPSLRKIDRRSGSHCRLPCEGEKQDPRRWNKYTTPNVYRDSSEILKTQGHWLWESTIQNMIYASAGTPDMSINGLLALEQRFVPMILIFAKVAIVESLC